MKNFGMDLSNFKKVKSDKHSTTLKHIKHGHQIVLAHKALSSKMRQDLDKIPMMGEEKEVPESRQMFAEKGLVESSQDSSELPNFDQTSSMDNFDPNKLSAGPTTEEMLDRSLYFAQHPTWNEFLDTPRRISESGNPVPDLEKLKPSGPSFQPAPEPVQQEAYREPTTEPVKPTTPGMTYPSFDEYLQQQQSALEGMEKAQELGAGGQQQYAKSSAEQEANFRQQNAIDLWNYKRHMQPFMDENAKIQKDLMDHPINAQRYMENMSTGSRILNAIGLILGGAGAGLTHGPNYAAQYLDDQIKNDIQAQIDNVGRKKSLFSHNLELLNNQRDAYNLTKLQSLNILQSQLRQTAAKAQGTAGAGTIQYLQAKLEKDKSDLMHNAAIQKMQLEMTGGLELLPPEMRERAVMMPDGSGYKLAIDKEGAKGLREQIGTMQPIFSQLDRLAQLGSAALVPGSKAAQTAQAIRAQLIPLVNENSGLKRLSGEDIHNIVQMFSDPTQFGQLMSSGARTQAFKQFLTDKLMSSMSNQLSGGYKPRGMPQAQAQAAEQPVKDKNGKLYIRRGNYMVPVGK